MQTEQEGLIARIRQMRRMSTARERTGKASSEPPPDRIQVLEARVAHLEQLVQGLQDSVHRESDRHARLIADLQDQVEPRAMRAAIARDTRERGL
jgi:hypothetical protein